MKDLWDKSFSSYDSVPSTFKEAIDFSLLCAVKKQLPVKKERCFVVRSFV